MRTAPDQLGLFSAKQTAEEHARAVRADREQGEREDEDRADELRETNGPGGGYEPGHPWYYRCGGPKLAADEIRVDVRWSPFGEFRRGKKHAAHLAERRKQAEEQLAKDLRAYERAKNPDALAIAFNHVASGRCELDRMRRASSPGFGAEAPLFACWEPAPRRWRYAEKMARATTADAGRSLLAAATRDFVAFLASVGIPVPGGDEPAAYLGDDWVPPNPACYAGKGQDMEGIRSHAKAVRADIEAACDWLHPRAGARVRELLDDLWSAEADFHGRLLPAEALRWREEDEAEERAEDDDQVDDGQASLLP